MLTIKFTETVPATGKTRHSKPFKLTIPRHRDGRIHYQKLLRSVKKALPKGNYGRGHIPQPATSVEAAWNYLHPASTVGTLLTLQDPESSNEAREKACRRLEWIIDGRFRSPRLREASEGLTRYRLRELREEALLLAAGDQEGPDEIRLGRQWITDRSGKKLRLKPAALTLPDYCAHIVQQARRILGQLVLEETGFDQQESSLPLDEAEAERMLEEVADERAGPLDSLIAEEEASAQTSKLDTLSSNLKKKQREFFQNLRSLVQHSPTLNFSEAIDRTARAMKISPANKRNILKKIRRTAKKPS